MVDAAEEVKEGRMDDDERLSSRLYLKKRTIQWWDSDDVMEEKNIARMVIP